MPPKWTGLCSPTLCNPCSSEGGTFFAPRAAADAHSHPEGHSMSSRLSRSVVALLVLSGVALVWAQQPAQPRRQPAAQPKAEKGKSGKAAAADAVQEVQSPRDVEIKRVEQRL